MARRPWMEELPTVRISELAKVGVFDEADPTTVPVLSHDLWVWCVGGIDGVLHVEHGGILYKTPMGPHRDMNLAGRRKRGRGVTFVRQATCQRCGLPAPILRIYEGELQCWTRCLKGRVLYRSQFLGAAWPQVRIGQLDRKLAELERRPTRRTTRAKVEAALSAAEARVYLPIIQRVMAGILRRR